jgi:predicted esterase YcpF (UPF0227 family)
VTKDYGLTEEQHKKLLRLLMIEDEVLDDLEEAAKYRLATKLIWKTKRQVIISFAALIAAIALLWEQVELLFSFLFKTSGGQ